MKCLYLLCALYIAKYYEEYKSMEKISPIIKEFQVF